MKTLTLLHPPPHLTIIIHKGNVTFLLFITWQEMMLLLAKQKSHYNNVKMNIKV